MAVKVLSQITGYGFTDSERLPGIEWLRKFKQRCPASIWLNPDPTHWWDHPTVSAIGKLFPMYELTVGGLQQAVSVLRRPA